MSEWLIEGRLVRTPCRACGSPTLSMVAAAFESQCAECLDAKWSGRGAVGPVPRGVARSHLPRPALELERAAGPTRTVAVEVCEYDGWDLGVPATATRLAARASGEVRYGAAWFCEGNVLEVGLGAFVLREVLAVRWPGGFACWSRSGKSGWKAGRALWRDGASFGYGAHSKIPATFFA